MTVVLFEPHADDICLFSLYSLLREQKEGNTVEVITVFAEDNQRLQESLDAKMVWAVSTDASYFSWSNAPNDLVALIHRMRVIDEGEMRVWAPMVEADGHSEHNIVGWAAEDVFGDRCRFYATYKRGHGRTRTDNEVIPEPDWYAKKFRAMSCYTSQINHPQMRPWFAADDCLREWVV